MRGKIFNVLTSVIIFKMSKMLKKQSGPEAPWKTRFSGIPDFYDVFHQYYPKELQKT